MKNIHILPTDQPSRLWIGAITGKLVLDKEPNTLHSQHIYITSDEEIGEGDWYLDTIVNVIFKNDKLFLNGTGYKKIILATDPTLIADGVQAIDDEFLEWFVKNPTCEYAEINDWLDVNGNIPFGGNIRYQICNQFHDKKIIIPQEEPKQETLEEAAERAVKSGLFKDKTLFITGAKWQAKRMYSEEDLREAFKQSRQCKIFEKDMPPVYETFEEWFEQFKKK